MSLNFGVFPAEWKVADVRPSAKKSNLDTCTAFEILDLLVTRHMYQSLLNVQFSIKQTIFLIHKDYIKVSRHIVNVIALKQLCNV